MSAVTSFRQFANTIREEPFHYTLGVTECKGVANIVIGSLQLIFSQVLKRSSKEYYRVKLAPRHVEIGTQALQRGAIQILPAAIVASSAYFTYRNWTLNQ